MLLNDFLSYVKTGKALDTDEIRAPMGEMSEEPRCAERTSMWGKSVSDYQIPLMTYRNTFV